VKRKIRFLFVIAMTVAISTALVRGTQEQEEGFGDKLKNFSFDRRQSANIGRKRKFSDADYFAVAIDSE